MFDGNLQLLDARTQRIWDSNLSTTSTYANRAVLLDSGNLVLTNDIEIQWQSFDYPTDTWLPGNYSMQLDLNQNGVLAVWNNLHEVWRSGSLNEGGFASVQGNKKSPLVALATSITSTIFVCATCYVLWRRKLKKKGSK
ncbi:hypothetical protein K7X08_018204 [Anisodus acutangulus]|uniref:Bulb-type lectin domain-containing protein n=1 Tax=Anisodus acutangulus TaxID=402998 RepID=A0A9Q1LXA5_9SOLA|nr:hypothetical protein K7X08_018204 [Anisodus acutangulus]